MTTRYRLAAAIMALLGVAACGSVAVPTALPAGSAVRPLPAGWVDPAKVPSAAAAPNSCGDPRASYPPFARSPSGPTLDAIRARGTLVVGVAQSEYQLAYRNPADGTMQGFEIDLIREIARRLLGSPDAVTFVVLNPQDWPNALRVNPDGTLVDKAGPRVDMVLGAMTMNCDRWSQWAFSTEYLHGAQRILVHRDSPVTGLADLGGRQVCSSTGSTNLAYAANAKTTNGKPIRIVSAPATSDCLAMLQQGQVDAVTTGDVLLAGFLAQDQNLKFADLNATPPIATVPIGIGMKKTQTDLIRFVNGVLADVRGDGRADRAHSLWVQFYSDTIEIALRAGLGAGAPPVPDPPNPVYRALPNS